MDRRGRGDFIDLQRAIEVASDGDVIVLMRGNYQRFEIDDKELAIVSLSLVDVRCKGGVIRNLSAGKTVVLVGVGMAPDEPGSALTLEDNAGSVRFERGQIDSSNVTGGAPGLFVDNCADVIVRQAFIRGAPDGAVPGEGIRVASSKVAIYNTVFEGGEGLGLPTDGAPGARVRGGFLLLSACIVVGGSGSDGTVFGDPLGGGGAGIVVEFAGDVRAQATSFFGGGGGETCVGRRCECCGVEGVPQEVEPGGSLQMLTSPPRAFSQYATAHECEDLPVDVSGQPGERVRLLFSYDSGFEYRPELASVRGLGEPLVAFAHRVSDGGVTAFVPLLLESGAMGEIDGNGGLSTQIPFRRLPPGQDAQVFFIQAALREPGVGVVALTPPATVVLLRDPFCGIERLYVDGDASPGGTGEDWSSAISDLHVALALAETDGFEEIWVKEGVYRPDVPGGSRAASFVVPAGVRLYGGFRGDETRLEQRVIDQERTTLSGDLDGDDLPGLAFENNDENSIHVVTLALPGGQLVDGLTIEGGNASIGLDIDSRGGGVVANGVSSWKLANCTLVRNEAVTEGGGLYANGGSYVVASCSFLGSQAVFGGGMYSRADGVQDAVLVNCAFSGCRADSGGGLYASGGAMGSGTGSITSCSFSANGAEFFGGGARFVNLSVSYPFAVSNSIFWRNFDVGGVDESSQLSIDSDPVLVGVSFSCIEGLDELAGNDNIGLDPLFVAPLGLDALTGTLDDDLGLDPTSPCIDSGLNVDLLPDVADLDADANDQEPTPRDRARRARRRDIASVPDMSPDTAPIVDRGAYELGDD